MAQHKIDKDFRIKLSEREIAPTANAWDRLDAMLTVAEQEKPKRDFGWLYIAASVVGFLLLGTVYFNSIPELQDVKRNPDNNVVLQNPEGVKTTPEIVPTVTDSQSIAAVTPANINGSIQTESSSQKSVNIHKSIINQKTINQSNPVQTINELPNQSTLIAEHNLLPTSKSESSVTSAKVDELIANAATAGPSSIKGSVKVNAKNLLSQVDGEVNQTFREKVIHKIGRNYHEVAQAVSSRNTQQ